MLSGIKVVELAHNFSGPQTGAILADLGAEVIKIERPEGDDARAMGPPFWGETAACFHYLNRNKKSVRLDLKKEEDFEALMALIADADVFLHNLRPGTARKMKLDAETLCSRFPRLIYGEVSGFGHQGPLSMKPGYELVAQAFSGIMAVTGEPDGGPMRSGPSLCDLGSGMWLAIGVLGALYRRQKSGKGSTIQTSIYETGLNWVGIQMAGYAASGKEPERVGSGHPVLYPYQVFETSTGPLIIAAGNDRLFQKLAEVIGRPELVDEPQYRTNKDRVLHKAELAPIIGEAVYAEGREVWMERLEAAGVPCVPVQAVSEVFHHQQTKALNIIQQPPDNESISLVCSPLNIDGRRPALRNAAPDIGQDDEEVLGRIRGREQDGS